MSLIVEIILRDPYTFAGTNHRTIGRGARAAMKRILANIPSWKKRTRMTARMMMRRMPRMTMKMTMMTKTAAMKRLTVTLRNQLR